MQRLLGGMSQTVKDKIQNMLIGQVVQNVLSIAAAADNIIGA
jgi:hypothetical protein